MIFTERTIKVTNGASQINSPIVLYKGDKNIKIRFKIVDCPYTYSKNVDNIIEVSEASYAQLVIKTPNNGLPIFSDIAETESGCVTFTITSEMIDEAEEVGKYSFQVRLLDDEQFSRITIPEVVDGIDVRDPIAIEDISPTNEVDIATVGYALTTAATQEDAFDSQGNYNKTTWGTGDRITAAKLNKIEAGIDGVNQKVASGSTGGETGVDLSIYQTKTDNTLNTTNKTVSGAINEINEAMVNEIIDIEKSINILDRDSDSNKIAGYIQADGSVRDYDELSCIDFLPIDTNHFYAISGFVNSYCAFYNESKALVSSGKPGDFAEDLNNFMVITPPSGSKFMRLTYTTGTSSRLNVLELALKADAANYNVAQAYEYYVRKHIKGINNIKENIVQIEGEINTLKETNVGVDVLKKGNLFDASKSIPGYIQANGTVRDYDTLWCSDYCEIEPGKLYRFGTVVFSYYAFYDENKTFIASWEDYPTTAFTETIYTVDTPQNAKYFRCTFDRNPLEATERNRPWVSNLPEKPYEDDTFVIKNLYPNTLKPVNPCDYSELTVQVFNKCLCIGDSLTYGGFNMDDNAGTTGAIPDATEQSAKYSYPSQFSKITGVQTTNKGVSGYSTVDWFNNFEREDLSGHDMCIIFLGVNDAAQAVTDDDTKLYLGKIVDKVKNENKHIKIYLMTIIPAYNADDYLHKNEVIKEFANGRSDVILLDIAKYGHARQSTSYTSGHLSALGYYMLAKDLARYISWHIDNNLRQYRDIQFIGTDGYYTKD